MNRLIGRLRTLAEDMQDIGKAMCGDERTMYIYHGRELLGAAEIVREWIAWIERGEDMIMNEGDEYP
ncbi:MAG: hypothetical protein AB1457_16195 [Chloroflexota bacterium]